jgi:hypothetical protein
MKKTLQPINKTVAIEIGLSENGGNLRRTKKCWNYFLGKTLLVSIVEIAFP